MFRSNVITAENWHGNCRIARNQRKGCTAQGVFSLRGWKAASCLQFVPRMKPLHKSCDCLWPDHRSPLPRSCQLADAWAVNIGQQITMCKSGWRLSLAQKKTETFRGIWRKGNRVPLPAQLNAARRGLQSTHCMRRRSGQSEQSSLIPILTQWTLISKNSCCLLRPFLCLSSAVAMECKWKESGSKNPAGKIKSALWVRFWKPKELLWEISAAHVNRRRHAWTLSQAAKHEPSSLQLLWHFFFNLFCLGKVTAAC